MSSLYCFALCALLLLAPGCSGCNEGAGPQDLMVGDLTRDADLGIGPDAAGDAEAGAADLAGGDGDAGQLDGAHGPDATKGCLASCQAMGLELCVQDSYGDCVECNSSADCLANPAALGPTCDTASSYCTCASDLDCAKSPWGGKCDTADKLCGCAADTHCGTATFGPTCDTDLASCSCAADTDCAASVFGKVCDTSGIATCYCSSSTDCPAGKACTGSLGLGAWTYCL